MSSSLDVNDKRLVLRSQPSMKSLAVFIGCVGVGLGAAIYMTDCWICKLLYLAILGGFGVWYLEDWQEAAFDKPSGKLTFSEGNIFQAYLCCCCSGRSLAVSLEEVDSVRACDEDDARSSIIVGTKFDSTYCKIFVNASECGYVCSAIKDFLKLDKSAASQEKTQLPEQQQTAKTEDTHNNDSPASDSPTDVDAAVVGSTLAVPSGQSDDASSVTSSEESFERVSATDLAEYEAVIADNGGSSGDLSPSQEIEDLTAAVGDGPPEAQQ